MIPARGLASAPRNDGVEIVDSSPLPIDAALPELTAALRASNAAVLVAPPGAGKTTRVPLVLAGQPWAQASGSSRRILVLEPRRLAARAAAARMAHNLNEAVGETVGLGVRVGALLGGAPVIESQGRIFPVETRYVGRDARPIEPQLADTIARAMRAERGSVLAFLPGAAEIRRTQNLLESRADAAADIVPLYGALGGDEQTRAIEPARPGSRKIVLATSIAETSITIEGVRVVVDSGLARVPRYEPDVGVTRLDTVRVSRAAADQRRGRAGRTEPGVCYRLWDEPQTAALEPF